MRRIIFLLTVLTLPPMVFADVQWLPAGGSLFPKIMADPEEVQTAGQYFRKNGQDKVDFSVGNNYGIAQWFADKNQTWPLQFDVSGVIIPRFTVSSLITLDDADYIVNLPLEARHGIYSARLSLFHKSSHLGDNYITTTGRQRIAYSREGVQSLFAAEPTERVRFYGGLSQLLHTDPNVGKTTVQGGFELRTRPLGHVKRWHTFAYLAEDVQWKQEVNWSANSDTQLGISLGFDGNPRRFRVFLNYFDGHSTYGQFYTEREHYLGTGIGFDF